MTGGGPVVASVNVHLADEKFRDQVRSLHAAQTPLVQMINELGLAEGLGPAVMAIVGSLDPDVVTGIRNVTLQMLDQSGLAMPVDCDVSDADIKGGEKVKVSVAGPTIVVRAAQ
jgi:hypothetical protein